MALLLAPYNNAMRIGMGFNSFTQQLCVNDAVQKAGGELATNDDARSVPIIKDGQPVGVPRVTPNSQTTAFGLQKTQGGTYVRAHKDGGQAEISQIVSWKSEFVDSVSEVTDSMNIFGSLAIKVDAIGGGAKAEGHYLNTETLKKSDLNYHIQVDVVNQKLFAEDVTQFVPIRNVTANQFKDVYGDCFISGFLEGGVFNALVSVKLTDKSLLKSMGGSIGIKASLAGGAVGVDGEGKGGKDSKDALASAETTVSVSWSGGGDIVTDSVTTKGWSMESLKEVAMSFADKVATCPQRTSAILTKYSSLRSFYEQSLKGSPLDYENAGVYSSALLDAYMEYKSIWRELQGTISEVEGNRVFLDKATETTDLQHLKDEIQASYKTSFDAFENSKKETTVTVYNAGGYATTETKKQLEPPTKPNTMIPYNNSLYGLEQAKRDCRFEMIKIVREVDAVSDDPKVAVAIDRNYQYLSPVIFRQLLPSSERVDIAKLNAEIQRLKEENKAFEANKTAKADLERSQLLVKELEEAREHSDKEHVDKVKDLRASQERSEEEHRREVREYQAQLSEGEKLKASAAKLEELFMNMQKAVDPLKDTQQKSDEQHQKQIDEGEKLKVSTAKLEELVTNMQKAVDPLKNAKEQQDQISRALAAWTKPHTSGNWKHHGFNVHSITYAGKTYESQSVVDTFLVLGRAGGSFKVNDHLLQDDPWPGSFKTLFLVYSYDDDKIVRHLGGGQNELVRFARQSDDQTAKQEAENRIRWLLQIRGWGVEGYF